MTATEHIGLEELAHAEQVIQAFPRMQEIDGFQIRLDDDWSGESSLYVTFTLKAGTKIDLAFLQRFNHFRLQVTSAVLNANISRFPYTSFQKAA